MKRLSLRARLLLICVALLAVGFTVSGAVVSQVLRGHLVDRVDSQLVQLTTLLGGVSPDAIPAFDPTVIPSELGARLDLIADVEIVYLHADGGIERLMHTPGPGAPQLPRLDTAAVAAHGGRPFGVADVDGGAGWRVVALPRSATPLLGGPPPAGSGIAVAASTSAVDGTVSRLRTICLLTGLALVAVLAAAGWFAIRAGLRPLRRIEQTAAAIAGGDLSKRVPAEAPPGTEIGRLSTALNGMLGQVETAFAARAASEARMRRFVADVSHELRTPLFGIKGFTELYRMGGVTGDAEVALTMARIESESARLAKLTEDLLLLARLDEGEAGLPLHRAPMDLRTLAADARRDLHALDPTREVTVTGPGGAGPPGPAPVDGDEARLRQVVANLVGNAVAHTPAGTPVRIGVGVEDGAAVFEVADRGPGLAPEDAVRVFDRFYRTSDSRDRTTDSRDRTTVTPDPTHDTRDRTTVTPDPTHDTRDRTSEPRDPTHQPRDRTSDTRSPTHDSEKPTTHAQGPTSDTRDPTRDPQDPTDDTRGDTSSAQGRGGGAGLGLAIVASLVSAHGGHVGVPTPTDGRGAVFRVTLPTIDQGVELHTP